MRFWFFFRLAFFEVFLCLCVCASMVCIPSDPPPPPLFFAAAVVQLPNEMRCSYAAARQRGSRRPQCVCLAPNICKLGGVGWRQMSLWYHRSRGCWSSNGFFLFRFVRGAGRKNAHAGV